MRRLSKLSITVPCVTLSDAPESFSPMVRRSPTPTLANATASAAVFPQTPTKSISSGRHTPSTPCFPTAAVPRTNQLPAFLKHLKRHPNQYYHLMSQFTKLCQLKSLPKHSEAIAKLPDNMCKNRYVDVLPYDHSRVLLNNDCFINASIVNVHDQAYILAQGPLQDTVGDYWRMVWQYKVSVMVNLTRLVEGGRPKCVQYWPEEDQVMVTGGLYIENVEQVIEGDLVKRVFYITEVDDEFGDGEALTVVQLHYLGWPDRGVPNDVEPVRKLVNQCSIEQSAGSPLLVHCSAGIGRTGCFVVAHSVIEKLKRDQAAWHDTGDLVQDAIVDARKSRKGVVQTAVQYGFCYDLVESWVHGQKSFVYGGMSAINSEDEEGEEEEEDQVSVWPVNLLQRIRNFAVWSP